MYHICSLLDVSLLYHHYYSATTLTQDAEVLEQIDRDVMRTHPDMHFFSGDDPAATLHREVKFVVYTCCIHVVYVYT